MGACEKTFIARNDKDRRSGYDRRKFSYAGHIPERRLAPERRCGSDRRA